MSAEIPQIFLEDLEQNIDFPIGYYWSNNFSPIFYINLAKKGFISTSNNYIEFGDILLPEMQEAYAVLYYNNLHIEKKIKKTLNSDYKIIINNDLAQFLPLLKNHHGDNSWFTDSYIKLMQDLLNFDYNLFNFCIKTTFLLYKGKVTAGEIGYFIGRTYTSLTGFYNKNFNNHGKIQMILLSEKLNQIGINLWNLGHPYMEYKTKLGAEIIKKNDFIKIWEQSISSKTNYFSCV